MSDPSPQSIWQRFVETGRLKTQWQSVIHPSILRSWQRCVLRLDPLALPRRHVLRADALERVQFAHFDLIAIARPLMEDVYQYTEGSGFVVLLADRAACVLDMLGDAPTITRLDALRLRPGAYWSEGRVGTNALALALHDAMPMQVTGPEHYIAPHHPFASVAAPIHDAIGRIVGVLALIGPHEANHPHTLAAVMAAARAATNQLQTDTYLQEANRRLSTLKSVFEAVSDGLLVWDEAECLSHVNQQASELLGLAPRGALGYPLADVLPLPPAMRAAADRGAALQDTEVTFTVNRRSVDCLVSMQPVCDGRPTPSGYIAILRPLSRVRQLVQRLVGAEATITLETLRGDSPTMRLVRRQARVAARGSAPVLIRGENGIGKYPLSQAIHNASERADGPFVTINCGSIPHEIMVSEFLGFERGAFPPPHSEGRPSKFELANGGTLLLAEVESLTLEMQAALLQVIHTGHVMRLGGTRSIPVDVRVIATSTADLEALVSEGSFRADLFYRFGIFLIDVPPLRDRVEDLPLLITDFLEGITQRLNQPAQLDPEARSRLLAYPWPGNLRELASVLERAVVHCEGGRIGVQDLPRSVRSSWVVTPRAAAPQPVLSLAEAERDAILRAGYAHMGHVTQMAESLGISRTTLWRKMKALDIQSEHFKGGNGHHARSNGH